MVSQTQTVYQHGIAPRIARILGELKQSLARKYPGLELRLFGSTARGEATAASDIDLFIRLPEITRAIEEDVFDTTYEFELKYDCVFDVIVLAENTLTRYANQLPVYQNILQEGITI